MIMVTENTFTSDPSTIRGLELEEVVHVISTKTKVSKKVRDDRAPCEAQGDVLPNTWRGVSVSSSAVNDSSWKNEVPWVRKVRKGKKERNHGECDCYNIMLSTALRPLIPTLCTYIKNIE